MSSGVSSTGFAKVADVQASSCQAQLARQPPWLTARPTLSFPARRKSAAISSGPLRLVERSELNSDANSRFSRFEAQQDRGFSLGFVVAFARVTVDFQRRHRDALATSRKFGF